MLTTQLQSTDLATQSRRRVLVVSPHFPPINAPDHQRLRIALPYFKELGWDATVLTVNPSEVKHPIDPILAQALPADLEIATTPALPARITQKIGLGNLGLRCWPFFDRVGRKLLHQTSFDLVFFSTTIFPVLALADGWFKSFNVPYIIDFQDPWRVDRQQQKKRAQTRPGGRLKYALDKTLAQYLEPKALRHVSHIVSVSPVYPEILQQRYHWLRPEQFTTLPFGAPNHDFSELSQLGVKQSIFDPHDGNRHWVYVGRGGSDMETALRLLFDGIQKQVKVAPDKWHGVKLHFVGTSYDINSHATPIETLAHQYDLGHMVSEHPQRISYFEAQQLLVDSDGILLIGSDDPSYSASKLYAAILAQRPLLALFHHQSLVVDILHKCEAGQVVTFGEAHGAPSNQLATALTTMLNRPKDYSPPTRWQQFEPYSGKAMATKLCHLFDRATVRAI